MTPPMHLLLRTAISLVWFYQGLWHKLLEMSPHHRAIMQQALGEPWGLAAMKTLGLAEAALGALVILHLYPRFTAWSQILLLIAMNAAGILFAGNQIPDIGGMLTMNFVFIAAICINAHTSARRVS